MQAPRFWTLTALTLALALTRLIPHPWNFTPVGAMCLFGGAYFTRRWQAFAVPLAALAVSDLVLAATLYGFHTLLAMPAVYLSFALIVSVGMLLRGRRSVLTVASAAVAAAAIHFFITNFAYWLFEGPYPHTWSGLLACFVAALPFQQNMLMGNLVFSALLFGGFAWAQRQFPLLREPAAPVALR